jgi:CO/xanthine dehydrogenase FAD-binding subunit
MPSVPYHRAESLDHALAVLSDTEGVSCLAGGTDLVVQMRDGRARPKAILDLTGLDLGEVKGEPDHWVVGSGVTMTRILAEAAKLEEPDGLALVAQAAARLGAWQIQNRATVGGNICNASPAADSACALMALDSEVELISKAGERRMPLLDFMKGPGETARRADEILTRVRIPRWRAEPDRMVVSHYLKVGGRNALVCAIASLAARTVIKAGRVVSCSMAFGSVAPTGIRARSAEELLAGQALTDELIAEAAMAARNDASPIDDLRASAAYRKDVVQALATQHLAACMKIAAEGG